MRWFNEFELADCAKLFVSVWIGRVVAVRSRHGTGLLQTWSCTEKGVGIGLSMTAGTEVGGGICLGLGVDERISTDDGGTSSSRSWVAMWSPNSLAAGSISTVNCTAEAALEGWTLELDRWDWGEGIWSLRCMLNRACWNGRTHCKSLQRSRYLACLINPEARASSRRWVACFSKSPWGMMTSGLGLVERTML